MNYGTHVGIAAGIIAFSVGINWFSFERVTKTLQFFTVHTVVVFGILVGFCARNIQGARLREHVSVRSGTIQWGQLMNLLIFNASGYDVGASIVGMVKDPAKTLPRATLVAALFTAAVTETVFVLTYAGSSAPASQWQTGQFALVAREAAGLWLQIWVVIAAVIVNLQSFTGALATSVYTLQSAARLRLVPAKLGAENRRGAPEFALALCGLLALGFGAVPVDANLTIQGVSYALIVLCEVACFSSVKPELYTVFPKSPWFSGAVTLVPAVAAAFALSVQTTWAFFGTLALVVIIGFTGNQWLRHRPASVKEGTRKLLL